MHPATRAVILGAATACLSAALTYLLVRFSVRMKLVAGPRSDRWHKAPTPNTGGVAIVLSCALVFAFAAPGRYGSVALASAGVALLGFVDDRVRLRPSVKFMGQSLAALAVIASGVVFRPTHWDVVDLPLTFLWIVGITNAFNLIDNMDGLCAGVAVIISVFRFGSAVNSGDFAGAALFAMLAGAFFGFLLFNYKPARIFMGDAGSMFAGFALASLTIASPVPYTKAFLAAFFYPALTFLYPIFDTALVSLLRKAAGTPISVGGRDHSSHRLASVGHSEERVVWLLWSLTAIGAVAGLLVHWLPIGIHIIATLLIVGASMFGIFLSMLPNYPLWERATLGSTSLRRWIPTLRAGITLAVEVLLAGVALLAAFLVRWEDAFLGVPRKQFLYSLPIVLGCQVISSLVFRTYGLGWRWFGLRDLLVLAKCALLTSALSSALIWGVGIRTYSRGVIVLFILLLSFLLAGLRICLRLFWQTLGTIRTGRRAAVLGSDTLAEMVVLITERQPESDLFPVLILHTDPAADHTRVQGLPVRYVQRDTLGILRQFRIEVLILCSPDGMTEQHRAIAQVCLEAGIPVEQFQVTISSLQRPEDLAMAASG